MSRIDVEPIYTSITRGDMGFLDNKWGNAPEGLVVGVEIIGRVTKTAGGSEFCKGDMVGVGYQVEACFSCKNCRDGNEHYCSEARFIPVDCPGGLADNITIDGRFAFRLPKKLCAAKYTPLMCAGLTTYSAIRKANIPESSRVGVLGVGSLGWLAVQFLHAMGHRVIAMTHTPEKAALLMRDSIGVGEVINIASDVVPNGSLDDIFVTASGVVDWTQMIKSLRPTGRLHILGLPDNKINIAPELLADSGAKQITGYFIGSRQDTAAMLRFAIDNGISPRPKVYQADKVQECIADMRRSQFHPC